MQFGEPFFGLVYADFDRNSACQTVGKGEKIVQLELPLKGCGTIQEPQRVFTNNIVVRFHPGLEMDGDEIITIVCRYPPPDVPLPVLPPKPIGPPISSVVGPPLKGSQLLFILSAIMFLTLMLLGLGVSYYCLSRRPIPVVRRLPMSIGSGSEITKLSTPPLEGLKVPRTHKVVGAVPSTSSSDDTVLIPSDYPSESHSDIPSLAASSGGTYDNQAYIRDNSSIYSEHYGRTEEFRTTNEVAQQSMVSRLPIAIREPSPTFDVQVRVKRPAPPAPLSSISSDTESLAPSIVERNNLSTIIETYEDRESVIIDSMPQDVVPSRITYEPELYPITRYEHPPITTVSKTYKETTEEHWAEDYPDSVPPVSIPDTRSVVSTDTRHDIHSITEMVDTTHLYQSTDLPDEVVEHLPEPPIVARKPEVTSQLVDDVFLRTITEKSTVEDIENHKRKITEYKAKPAPSPTWDVTIRNHPTQDKPQWEDFSDISSAPSVQIEPVKYTQPPQTYIDATGEKLTSPELVGNMKPIEIPPEDKSVPNWDVLIRILENQEETTEEISTTTMSRPTPVPGPATAPATATALAPSPIPDDTSSTHSQTNRHILQHQISYDDKIKWRDIITTESTLRTMLTEAVVREDFERIRSDTRYETIFEPQTWDVIIRILAPPDDVDLRSPKLNRKPWDLRSRRSSLPTLYEYDSDGGSSVRTIPQDMLPMGSSNTYHYPPQLRRTSRTSYNFENVDIRSMTEVLVDFGRPETDNVSDISSYYPNRYYDDDPYDRRSIHRSLSQPSLARSATDFTERWAIPDDVSDDSESPRNSNRLVTFRPHVHRPHHVTTETQYIQQSSSSFQATSTTSPPKEWYGDSSK
ncbi:uncharacterized protein LOC129571035 [Sitodiplosis mosellana]|uniref:uncharacterized protein LOC129571035 n=1 Tax=Sitodiplosis mosellana TaxID=263140 RepID=UPI002443FB31|nr:uncharacterized protein LOC129571035 [Sitodiplosis mosellana]